MPVQYPFSAVLGCAADALDDMGLALVLVTIAPQIGGVLIRGEKGTAKSTAVRALAAVLPPIEVYAADRFSVDPADPGTTSPDGPFPGSAETVTRPVRLVELPVGATEDRVLGSLHLERALSHGKVEYEPGLLARAHRGILYADEVNLLHDHLVDLLLDAAAMGRATVERDGVSVEHASRFVLIGTMNPEEGELRPQLLDRFGLTVEVAAPRDPVLRAEVIRRRMGYDADPAAFCARYAGADRALTARIEAAREHIAKVRLTEAALLKIAEVCAAFEVDGLRADIVTARAAVAHAAWAGRDEVTRDDIRQAALLALPHRRRRNPFDAPGLDEELLDQVLGDGELPPEPPERPGPARPCSALMPQGQPGTVPEDGLTTRQRRNRPLLMIHTGDGKGKSTAAFGLALRGWNQGWKIGVFQFVKSAKWRIGEQTVLERLGQLHGETGEGGPVEWHKMGSGWSWSRKQGEAGDHAAAAAEGWQEIKRRLAGQAHDLLILDEFTYPMKWGWVNVDDVVETLSQRPGFQHVIITGRDADSRLVEIADLVTDMTKVKHPMDAGQKGQKGIEW